MILPPRLRFSRQTYQTMGGDSSVLKVTSLRSPRNGSKPGAVELRWNCGNTAQSRVGGPCRFHHLPVGPPRRPHGPRSTPPDYCPGCSSCDSVSRDLGKRRPHGRSDRYRTGQLPAPGLPGALERASHRPPRRNRLRASFRNELRSSSICRNPNAFPAFRRASRVGRHREPPTPGRLSAFRPVSKYLPSHPLIRRAQSAAQGHL